MGRKKKNQNVPDSVEQTSLLSDPMEQLSQHNDERDEPERFDPSLILQPAEIRQNYFENDCIILHLHLEEACDKILRAICSPGVESSLRRLGKMVLVIGPTRVGKTTLIRELEKRLLERAKERMLLDPSIIPYATINIPSSGRFEWIDYYKAVLRAIGDPFIDRRINSLRGRDFREAMEVALIQRKPYAVIVDEAQHLAKAARGSSLQEQLDQLKYFENVTGVSHVLVGTYEMRPFRRINAQLACRSIDVHFPRYDATEDDGRALFKRTLWALQRQLPLEEEPQLVENHWELLYAHSIGCIGQLKMHLNEALALALTEGAKTITKEHLIATALTEDRVTLAFETALKGEGDLFEAKGANERLIKMIWDAKREQMPLAKEEVGDQENSPDQQIKSSRTKRKKPGNRLPNRDTIGAKPEVDVIDGGEPQEESVG
jgi:AAA domain